jgi:hypothetical protein
MIDWNSQPQLRFQEARVNGQMVCVICGGFSSAQVCWQCGHLKQQIAEACAEKDKCIEQLKEHNKRMQDWVWGVTWMFKNEADGMNRLENARSIIQHIGYTSADDSHVIKAALKWLEGRP